MPQIQTTSVDTLTEGQLQELVVQLFALAGYVQRRKELLRVKTVGSTAACAEAERHAADARLQVPDTITW